MFSPAWAVACMYVNVHLVPIFFSAGGVNAWAGVLSYFKYSVRYKTLKMHFKANTYATRAFWE